MYKTYSNKKVIFVLVMPAIITFVFAILFPICLSLYYSFTDFTGMGSANFIGLENFKTLVQDTTFWRSLLNSLLLAIGFIAIQHPLAIITAAILDRIGGKPEAVFRCIYFIPNVISVAVIAYVRLMKQTVGDAVKVKAAGAIRDWKTCAAMIDAGAERIGTSSSLKILQEFDEAHEGCRAE